MRFQGESLKRDFKLSLSLRFYVESFRRDIKVEFIKRYFKVSPLSETSSYIYCSLVLKGLPRKVKHLCCLHGRQGSSSVIITFILPLRTTRIFQWNSSVYIFLRAAKIFQQKSSVYITFKSNNDLSVEVQQLYCL